MEGLTGQNEAAADTCALACSPLPARSQLADLVFSSCKRPLLDNHVPRRVYRLLRPVPPLLLFPLAGLLSHVSNPLAPSRKSYA